MKNSLRFLLSSCLLMLVLVACSRSNGIAGKSGVDETSNGVTAYVVDPAGAPASQALVLIRPVHYRSDGSLRSSDPDSGIWTLVTDVYGRFHLDSLPAGQYTLEVAGDGQGAMMNFDVAPSGLRDSVLADTLSLNLLASVKGRVQLPPGVAYARIVVEGLERLLYTDSAGNFTGSDLPAGNLQVVALMPGTDGVLGVLNVVATAGGTLDVGSLPVPVATASEWLHAGRIVLNTRASGVQIGKRLVDYPLMVRLEGDQFPLEAAHAGADLRVLDTAGNPLPFTLSFWDPLSRKACIWVRLPRVEVNDSLVVAVIQWGRPGSLPLSAPRQVFDTLDGWVGSYALQSSYLDSAGVLRTPDAAGYALHGQVLTTSGLPPDFGPEGTWFDGVSQGVAIGDFPLDLGSNSFTIEAWLKPQTEGGIWLTRDTRSDGGTWNHGERAFYFGWAGTSVNQASGWQPAQVSHEQNGTNVYVFADDTVAQNQWVHLAIRKRFLSATSDTAEIQFFVNGSLVESSGALVLEEPDKMRDSLYIGGQMFGRGYQGWISHLHISRGLRSAEWLYLNSRIQLAGTTALVFHRQN